ncbi:hypothetical protein SOP56_09700 [Weissella confusa]|uniref:hypothetical protein n=1 Tax=Weissella confusa TaxID=1583 RepID=UPI002A74CCC4|nr:hypothetical protein [Weissella confusa]MDY2530111.1 hypothetical protein [Weissella confusa]
MTNNNSTLIADNINPFAGLSTVNLVQSIPNLSEQTAYVAAIRKQAAMLTKQTNLRQLEIIQRILKKITEDFKRLLQNCLPKYQELLVSNVQPIDFSLINLHFNWIVPGTWIDDALDEPETYDQMMNRIVLSRVNGNNHQEASYFYDYASEDNQSSIKREKFNKLIQALSPVEYVKTRFQDFVFFVYDYLLIQFVTHSNPINEVIQFIKSVYHLFFR